MPVKAGRSVGEREAAEPFDDVGAAVVGRDQHFSRGSQDGGQISWLDERDVGVEHDPLVVGGCGHLPRRSIETTSRFLRDRGQAMRRSPVCDRDVAGDDAHIQIERAGDVGRPQRDRLAEPPPPVSVEHGAESSFGHCERLDRYPDEDAHVPCPPEPSAKTSSSVMPVFAESSHSASWMRRP